MLFGFPGTAGLPSRDVWRSEVSGKEGDRAVEVLLPLIYYRPALLGSITTRVKTL